MPDAACCVAKAAGEYDSTRGPAVVEANDNKIVYEITFNLLDAGLPMVDQGPQLIDNRDDTINIPIVPDNKGIGRRYPHKLVGVWLAINLTAHMPHGWHSYNLG